MRNLRYSRTVNLLGICSVLVSLIGCVETGKSTTSTTTSSDSSLAQYKSQATQGATKATVSSANADAVLRKWLLSAERTLVVVEDQPPAWLLAYLQKIKTEKPYVQIYFVSKYTVSAESWLRAYTVPTLKGSYIIIDRKWVVLNPVYDQMTRGLMHVQSDSQTVSDYTKFTSWMINTQL